MTLAVAIVAVLLAGAALGWQIWTHISNGPRVRLEIGSSVGRFLDGHAESWVRVTVINEGRAATTVTVTGFLLPGGGGFGNDERSSPDTLPRRLEPQDSFTFRKETAQLLDAAERAGCKYTDIRPMVRLSTGKVITGPPPVVSGAR